MTNPMSSPCAATTFASRRVHTTAASPRTDEVVSEKHPQQDQYPHRDAQQVQHEIADPTALAASIHVLLLLGAAVAARWSRALVHPTCHRGAGPQKLEKCRTKPQTRGRTSVDLRSVCRSFRCLEGALQSASAIARRRELR